MYTSHYDTQDWIGLESIVKPLYGYVLNPVSGKILDNTEYKYGEQQTWLVHS